MRTRSVLLLLPVLGFLGACAAEEPTYDGVEPAEFATASCTGWTSWTTAADAGSDLPLELTGSGEEQKAEALEAAEGIAAAVQQASDDVVAAQPAVEDGAAIVGYFTTYYDERLAVTNARIDEFRDFPTDLGPNEDEIQIEAIDLFSDIGEYGEGQPTGFPFEEIEDQDVIAAIDAEPSCDDLVRVT